MIKVIALQKTLFYTVYASLIVQILTGSIDIHVVLLKVPGEIALLKKLLGLELAVQFVEGFFYVWFASTFAYVSNVTPNRYFDWMITTPTMLFTFCIYLNYLKQKEKTDETLDETSNNPNESQTKHGNKTLIESFQEHQSTLIPVLLLNWMMLIFGYLGEIKVMNNVLAILCGFIPFFAGFWMIYHQYAKYTNAGLILFWSFGVVWALYGVAAFMPYYWKNIGYNILDLVAKNFFGLFLAYVVYTNYNMVV